jgi:hypothetical protein
VIGGRATPFRGGVSVGSVAVDASRLDAAVASAMSVTLAESSDG